MAKKKTSRKSSSARGSRKAAPAASGLWRLSLIVFAIVCFRLLELADIRAFEFVRLIRDAWGVADYNINFIMFGASCLGLAVLLFSNASKSALNIIGSLLLLNPVWLHPGELAGGMGAKAVTLNSVEPLTLFFSISAVLWSVCMLRNSDKRLQLVIGAVLIAENIALCFMANFPIDWWQLVTIDAFAILAGLSMDFAYNGFSWATLLPVAAIVTEFMLKYANMPNVTTGYVTIGVCVAGLIALAAAPGLRKGSAGIAAVLCGIAANALSILYLNGMLDIIL